MDSINHLQSIIDGQITNTKTKDASNNLGSDSLGKDAFLQLLVTQLKYQDPLNPSADTEFIAQLASFSQLEAMQNLSQNFANTQAFSLVGKQVVLRTETDTSTPMYILGKVDYVTVEGGKTYLTINDNLYNIEDLYQVVDEDYLPDSIKEPPETDEV